MADTTTPDSQTDNRLGGLSLICLGLAAVGPFLGVLGAVSRSVGSDPAMVGLGFRAVFVLLALVLGFLGRRSRAGKLGFYGSAAVLVTVLILVGFLLSRRPVPVVAPSPAVVPIPSPPPPSP